MADLSCMRALNIPALFLIFFVFLATGAQADPVYRQTDSRGIPVYSSKPKEQGAQPAKLPTIAKAHMGEPAVKSMSTCVGHGGINCQAGPDADGSVICYDGNKESLQRFAFSCASAKLVIIHESQKLVGNLFSVLVRNTSTVAATGIQVSAAQGLMLQGPSELAALDSAEYFLRPCQKQPRGLQLSCENCP